MFVSTPGGGGGGDLLRALMALAAWTFQSTWDLVAGLIAAAARHPAAAALLVTAVSVGGGVWWRLRMRASGPAHPPSG